MGTFEKVSFRIHWVQNLILGDHRNNAQKDDKKIIWKNSPLGYEKYSQPNHNTTFSPSNI